MNQSRAPSMQKGRRWPKIDSSIERKSAISVQIEERERDVMRMGRTHIIPACLPACLIKLWLCCSTMVWLCGLPIITTILRRSRSSFRCLTQTISCHYCQYKQKETDSNSDIPPPNPLTPVLCYSHSSHKKCLDENLCRFYSLFSPFWGVSFVNGS